MYWIPFIILVLLIILYFLYANKKNCIQTCINVHSESGENYPWLSDVHGGLDFIEYKEKAIGANDWTRYTENTWKAHCAKISHDPTNLVEAHRQAFLVPNSPIKLRFHFKDGTVEELQDNEKYKDYYRREAAYFQEYQICKGQKNSAGLAINP